MSALELQMASDSSSRRASHRVASSHQPSRELGMSTFHESTDTEALSGRTSGEPEGSTRMADTEERRTCGRRRQRLFHPSLPFPLPLHGLCACRFTRLTMARRTFALHSWEARGTGTAGAAQSVT
eukprot:scaffold102596_cov30-Tisochrysis_lutea.AAC.1